MWTCYLLGSVADGGRNTYVGVTTNMARRLRQHNREIRGGARATGRCPRWAVMCWVEGFRNRSEVQQFETRVKQYRRRCGGQGGAIRGVQSMLCMLRLEHERGLFQFWMDETRLRAISAEWEEFLVEETVKLDWPRDQTELPY